MQKIYLNTIFVLLYITLIGQTSYTFNYTGTTQSWVVPPGVCQVQITIWGAGGGGGGTDTYAPGNGGNGGYAQASFNVNPGDNLTIYVGQGGGAGMACATSGPGGTGGWGYGNGANGGASGGTGCSGSGGGGGGASAVLINGTVVLVAGGGGGGGGGGNYAAGGTGGLGGGTNGTAGNNGGSGGTAGGNSNSNGTNGQSFNGDGAGAGGGGGGYVGGTGGSIAGCDCGGGGGGGGTSYCNGMGCVLTNGSGSSGGGPATNGTNGIVQVTVTQSTSITSANITSQNITCNGFANGTATLNVTTSNPPVSYTWSNGSNTQNVTNLGPGTYTVTYKDAGGCTFTKTVSITQPAPMNINGQTKNVKCYGQANGSATINVSGGTAPYSYTCLPSPGATSANTVGGLSAGNYTVYVTDANSCPTQSLSFNITQPPDITVSITHNDVACYQGSDGSANGSANGGSGFFNWAWTDGTNTISVNPYVGNLSAGDYTLIVTDMNGCVKTASIDIGDPPPLKVLILSTQSITCNGGNNGSANVLGIGGVGGFTYSWTPGGFTGPSINNVQAGTYTVIVTDTNNCVTDTAITIIQPPALTLTAVQQQSVLCYNGFSGIASAALSGGVPGYNYAWYDVNNNNISVTYTANNLGAGNYTVIATDANGCSTQTVVNITQPPPVNFTVSQTINNIGCFGTPNNTVFINTIGGVGNYTYSSIPSGITSSANINVPQGNYTISVGDSNGCTSYTVFNVILPAPFSINAFQTQSVTCYGLSNGSASVSAVGGGGSYTYTWQALNQYGQTTWSLSAGIYTVTVTSRDGCTLTDTVQIFQPPPLVINSLVANPATCGNANGSATVNASGGWGTLTYSWTSIPVQTSSVSTGLTGGLTYSVFVRDVNGCTVYDTITIPDPPVPVIISATYTAPLCYGGNDGSASVNFISGTPPATITWQPGNHPSVATINNLSAGIYTVSITDSYGCTTNTTILVSQPPALSLNVTPTQTICYGANGTVQAMPTGGTPPYTYNWNPSVFNGGGPYFPALTLSSNYIVNITDAHGCSIGPDTVKINVLPPLQASGIFTTVCEQQQPATIWANITSPGNGGPYTYTWTTGATTPSITVTGIYPTQPNTYTIIISDGCTVPSATAIATVSVHPLPKGYFTSDFIKGCAPLNVFFSAISNGTNDSYQWDFGNGNTQTGNPVSAAYSAVGSYSVKLTITSQYGCHIDTIANPYITVYPNPTADFEPDKYESSIFDPVFTFTNESVGATHYMWDFGAPDQPNNQTTFVNPIHYYTLPGEYNVTLVAINEYNCEDRASKKVYVHPDYVIYIPNAFTPDGNMTNDIFQPKGVGLLETPYKMYIFDRWGEVIFTSEEFSTGWDGRNKNTGKMAEQGVYVYKIIVEDLSHIEHVFTGHVTLLGNIR